jgi:N-acetylglucosaminyldiphosphoundecaprenol N-acetyl-beta-D-mannosaminyltransferase
MSTQAKMEPVAAARLGWGRPERIAIGDALVDRCSFQEALDDITAHALQGGAPAYVVTPNAQHIVLLDRQPRLREIYRDADLVVPDGYSLVLAARALGQKLPERVAGVDLFQALCGRAAESGLRVFLLGGRTGSAELAAAVLRKRFGGLQVATHCPPLGFEDSEIELGRIAHAIALFRPDLLFVALGAPKQEHWMYDHGRKLGVAVSIGVGGSFEMVTGIVPRAPRWIQDIGCEWVYRLCREPRRMWRRYLVGHFQFAEIILRQVLGRLPRAVPDKASAETAAHPPEQKLFRRSML